MSDVSPGPTHRVLDRTAGAVGLLVYASVGLLPLVTDQAMSLAWWALWVVGLPVFGLDVLGEIPRRLQIALLVPMTLIGTTMYVLEPTFGFGGVPMVITAASAGLALPLAGGLSLVAAQSGVMLAVGATMTEDGGMLAAVFYIGLQVFAVMTGQIAQREAAAREAISRVHDTLSATHAELRRAHTALEAAQIRLAESSRTDERLRISRDLHDLVGHQLSALIMNLEAASHRVDGDAVEPVHRSRAIARDLLDDVRTVVSRLREDRALTLGAAVRDMAVAITRPRVELDVTGDLPSLPPETTDALVHCVQELLTNAVRHSQAEHLRLSVTTVDKSVRILARDDGRGAPDLIPGNGLTGMRERVTALGGTMCTDGSDGFAVSICVPVETVRP